MGTVFSGPEQPQRDTLYYRLSLVWLAIVAGYFLSVLMH
ncbi:hypothetical protein GGD66_003458 [Bradyrhizobium sp. CIR48]|nr:hypothetical protein [Bradyrhizobium sp. CIR18]MBB4393633.1 hypothetical protein [Bradyrhizobium sp. ERR14]MBB4424901.1 hypothetical protein [Bradyrhizobium sp. CIR48]